MFRSAALTLLFGAGALASVAIAAPAAEEKAARRMPELKVDASPVGREGVLTSYADVLEPVQRSVVTIYARKYTSPAASARRADSAANTNLGSGVIVSPDGYILTNNHVVSDADVLDVELAEGAKLTARIIGSDPQTDVAVIKIDAEDLPTITLADSNQLRVGDVVFAVGNPLEVGQSVTMGIVSAKGRNVGIISEAGGIEDFIQTDAAINMGNSGGPLVDAKGRLVGINSAILSTSRGTIGGNIGIGFSVPVNVAATIMRSLVETGSVSRGFLGVHVANLDADVAETYGLRRGTRGVAVTEVVADSPAARAGLKADDVVLNIDGRTIGSEQELRVVISQKAPGAVAKVEFVREGKPQTLEVVLSRVAEDFLIGVQVEMLNPETRRSLQLDATYQGLWVKAIAPRSPYSALEKDMVILEINSQRFTDLESARKLLKEDNRFLVQSGRNGTPRLIRIRVEP